jgi:hypothetical protein
VADLESKTAEELDRVQTLVRYCEVSRQQRAAVNAALRDLEAMGAQDGPRAPVNKLRSHLNRLQSYLFAPDVVRFSPHLPKAVRAQWITAAGIARDEFAQVWHDSGADLVFVNLLLGALTTSATVAKVQHDPETTFTVGYIRSEDFGVASEDIPILDQQNTMAHWYDMAYSSVERWLHGDPREDDLLAIAREHSRTPGSGGRSGQRLVVSNIAGTFPNSIVQGGFPGDPDRIPDGLGPSVEEPTVPFVDLWERRLFRRRSMSDVLDKKAKGELFEDWQVTTLIGDGSRIFLQRRNPVLPWTRMGKHVILPGEHPFVMVVPRPVDNYLWGRSELNELRKMQDWFTDHLEDMRRAVKRKFRPSKFATGVSDMEEAARALDTDAGLYATPEPAGTLTPVDIWFGQEAFAFEQMLEKQFDEISGIPGSLADPANQPGGVRSAEHFAGASSVASGRILLMARLMEDPLGQIATKGFHLLQRHDTTAYDRPDGPAFLLSQLPAGLSLTVDSHSSSPIFREQTEQKGFALKKAGVIGGPDLIEMVNPANKDELKERAKGIEEAQAEKADKMLAIQEAKATKSGRVGRPPK